MRFAAPPVCRNMGQPRVAVPALVNASNIHKDESGAATEGRPYKLMEIPNDHQHSNTKLRC
jgi:hypothetical protein